MAGAVERDRPGRISGRFGERVEPSDLAAVAPELDRDAELAVLRLVDGADIVGGVHFLDGGDVTVMRIHQI